MEEELKKLTKEELLSMVEEFEHYPSVTEDDDKDYILSYLEDESCTISEKEIGAYLLKNHAEITKDNIHLYYEFMDDEQKNQKGWALEYVKEQTPEILNYDKIGWEEFKEMVKKFDFDYSKNDIEKIGEDKKIYIDNLDMTLYDFCNLYFKRTYETRSYSTDNRYFNLNCFYGHKVMSISKAKKPSLFIIPNDDKLKKNFGFEVIVYNHDNSNIVLRYKSAYHFVLDIFDFMEKSYKLGIHPLEFKNMFLSIFSIENPIP